MDWIYLTLDLSCTNERDSFQVIDISENALIIQLKSSQLVYRIDLYEEVIRKSTRINLDDD